MHGINSCLWINQLNDVVATAALQTLNFIKMKTLTRDEMKKVMGGVLPPTEAWKCCIGDECTSCSQSPGCGPKATQTLCWS